MSENALSPKKLILGFSVVAFVTVGSLAWWLGLLTPEPEAVSLDATVQSVDEQSTLSDDAEPAGDVDPEMEVDQGQDVITAEAESIAGVWTIIEQDGTFAGYRADSKTGEAVGRTPGVTGSLEATANQISTVEVTVDMTTLTSDSSLRDDHLGDQGIEYDTFPVSTFVLSEPIQIDGMPNDGESIAFNAVGNLTVRDTTLPVEIALEGALVGEQLVVVGEVEISLDDYGASVNNTTEAVMEFSLVFAR